MKPKRPRKDKGKSHEKPLSLYPLSFDQAVSKLIAAKPKKKPPKT